MNSIFKDKNKSKIIYSKLPESAKKVGGNLKVNNSTLLSNQNIKKTELLVKTKDFNLKFNTGRNSRKQFKIKMQ